LQQIVLVIGNILNAGGFGGIAKGFKISSLLKVSETSESFAHTTCSFEILNPPLESSHYFTIF
jgi:hypothetical protein